VKTKYSYLAQVFGTSYYHSFVRIILSESIRKVSLYLVPL